MVRRKQDKVRKKQSLPEEKCDTDLDEVLQVRSVDSSQVSLIYLKGSGNEVTDLVRKLRR